MEKQRIAVPAPGRGSNLQAILEAAARGDCPVDVALVLSDKPDAGALTVAATAGVARILHLNPGDYADRAAFDAACAEPIEAAGCELIVLAGYMRILGPAFVERFRNRIVNIHPSLLPAFPGAHAVADALAHGVKLTGVTVHLVTDVLDGGPILAQAPVEVMDDDTVESLHRRIHAVEHRLYPATLRRMIEEGFHLEGRRVIWHGRHAAPK